MAEDPTQVPLFDADSSSTGNPSNPSQEEIEQRTLDAERRLNKAEAELLDLGAKKKSNREADQRFWLRNIVFFFTIFIIICMGCLLAHVAHWLPNEPKVTGIVIAVHIAPIISITTLSIALLVAAFRGFKDGDEKAGAAVATEGARATGIIN